MRPFILAQGGDGRKQRRTRKETPLAKEIEIKLKLNDVRAFHRAMKRLGAHPVGRGTGKVHEENVIFDTPQGGLAKHGQLLRIRTVAPESNKRSKSGKLTRRVVLTFKQPIARPAGPETGRPPHGPHKVREEIEVEVADADTLTKIFEGLGMAGWFRYEKYRTTFQLPASRAWARGLLIELDETPIGTFVELEGPAAAIDRAAQELGYSRRDYVLKNYLVLYMEECRRKGERPLHMVFPKGKAAAK